MSYTILPEPDTSTLPEEYVKNARILKTVADGWGGKFHIKLDDGCYVCVHETHHTGKVEIVEFKHISPELFAALRDLPCPLEMHKQILRELGLEPFTEEVTAQHEVAEAPHPNTPCRTTRQRPCT
ncbi:hypothetical protein [Oleidesulfovibrio sp.]|uniref:hypothetical protein n=1 Tax=Oleidesulfovibrio sp. TaxID=2909707 RepID=UPI003A8866E0